MTALAQPGDPRCARSCWRLAATLLLGGSPSPTSSRSARSRSSTRGRGRRPRATAPPIQGGEQGGEADRLVGVASDVARCGRDAQPRRSTRRASASMRPVQAVDLPPGGQAQFAPGGLHVMLVGLARAAGGGRGVPAHPDLRACRAASPSRSRSRKRPPTAPGRAWSTHRAAQQPGLGCRRAVSRTARACARAAPTASNSCLGQQAQRQRRLLERGALLVGLLRDLGGVVVADLRVERRHQHQALVEQLGDPLAVGLDADHAIVGEAAAAVGEQPDRLQHVVDDQRLEDVELEVAVAGTQRSPRRCCP